MVPDNVAASQVLRPPATQQFVQQLFANNSKEIIKVPHHYSFVRRISMVTGGFPSQMVSTAESFPCHDTIMVAYSACKYLTNIMSSVVMMTSSNENISCLLAISAGNSPVTGKFPSQRPVTRTFDTVFDLQRNKRLSKWSWGMWFETLSCPLWRYCNVMCRWCRYDASVSIKSQDRWQIGNVSLLFVLPFNCNSTKTNG